ncbi:pimeloyl-ACP methyl ester esterase BioH [Gallaecimonas kandeliae]|uniref:pimeloyl-ACP methyl ester esterase BioH n=1 Tax=Gallaecimonas kandeliae TaxID=3029055 RepID=UPI0026481CAC|nr:pimeloyl-ACP methyl ester esterase BioH [Gallaecimonas kandeliae]WKE65873.1 pimeloyl-ACP methyl ester esterase BioH [Gallaecimonas kandeliae]
MSAPTLVMLHGWGVNGAVFSSLLPHLQGLDLRVVDLPGFGDAAHEPAHDQIDALARAVAAKVPDGAVWLGWSLGGLVATQAALEGHGNPRALITLASSPAFLADSGWPGIKPLVLAQFADALDGDIGVVIDRFLAIQAMGAPSAKADIKALRQRVVERPLPSHAALAGGLKILEETDLRGRLEEVEQPFLRLYGRLDALVPGKQQPLVDALAPQSQSLVFEHASHAPFISHPQETAKAIRDFVTGL